MIWSATTDLGVSRLSAWVDHDPPTAGEVARLRDRVRDEIAPLVDPVAGHGPGTVVAVGGTVRALARVVAADAGEWLPATLNQYAITTATLDGWCDTLLALDLDARLGLPGMKARRADRLHLAALVVSETLDLLGVADVLVSDWGLREGVLLDALGVRDLPDGPELRTRAVGRLRDAFAGDDPHLPHVAQLAGEVFDATTDVHGLDPGDRDLLVHAANLHDVGESLALRGHHRHGAYIVENAEMRGFSPAETALLATLVRFHRSAGTDTGYPPYAALSRDDRRRADRLLALLQIADGLDRARDQAVGGVRSRRDGDRLVLEATGSGIHAAIAEVDRKLDLFERTFGVEVSVVDAAAR